MKKIVTVIAFALICSGAYAQFNQGRYLAGGSLSFSATTDKTKTDDATTTNSRSTSFSLTPDVGYFVIDNLAVGAGLNLTTGSTKGDGDNDKSSSTTFTFNPFARYYLDQGLFFQAQVGFGSQKSKTTFEQGGTTVTVEGKANVFSYGLGVGYAYFLNDYVAIEPMFGYGSASFKNKDNDSKDITGGIFLNVGLQVYLGARN